MFRQLEEGGVFQQRVQYCISNITPCCIMFAMRISWLHLCSLNLGLHFHNVWVNGYCVLSHNTHQALFRLIKHSFSPTAWNCVTRQRSPLACPAAGTTWRGSVTPNNSKLLFIQQPGSQDKTVHMTRWITNVIVDDHSVSSTSSF